MFLAALLRDLPRASILGGGGEGDIDLSRAEAAGDANAPVTLVVYACPRCPYCTRVEPALRSTVTTGLLASSADFAEPSAAAH